MICEKRTAMQSKNLRFVEEELCFNFVAPNLCQYMLQHLSYLFSELDFGNTNLAAPGSASGTATKARDTVTNLDQKAQAAPDNCSDMRLMLDQHVCNQCVFIDRLKDRFELRGSWNALVVTLSVRLFGCLN